MSEPVFVECRGCWRLAVLGISNEIDQQVVVDRETGLTEAIVDVPMPSHDTEVCPDCGREHEFPPLHERRPDENEHYETVTFRFGPPEWPERAEENFLCSRRMKLVERFSRW